MEIGFSVFWLVLCYAVAAYAGKKGRSMAGFFLLSLFLSPLIGFLFVLASPSYPQRMGLKKCPQCAEWVQPDALKCRFCATEFAPASQHEQPAGNIFAATGEVPTGNRSSSVAPLVLGSLALLTVVVVIAVASLHNAPSASANEAAAIGSLRSICTNAVSYHSMFSHGYPSKLAALGPPASGANAGPEGSFLIDPALAAGEKDGYVFEYTPGSTVRGRVTKFQVVARPKSDGASGRHFFVDESGVIRQSAISDANKYSPPL